VTRGPILGLLALAASAFVPMTLVAACEQQAQKPADPGPCFEKSDTGWGSAYCRHPHHRLEVHGNVTVCRCVRPEPAVSR
jgi:hypothetical protein